MIVYMPFSRGLGICHSCRRFGLLVTDNIGRTISLSHYKESKNVASQAHIFRNFSDKTMSTGTSANTTKHNTSAGQLNKILQKPYNEELKTLFGGAKSQDTLTEYFRDFKGLHPYIVDKLEELGYSKPLPVQRDTLKATLQGKDVVIKSITGSGKTLAFVLPILNKIAHTQVAKSPQAIIVAPTRELCGQIAGVIESFIGSDRVMNMTGGNLNVKRQGRIVKFEKDIIVATPGRIMQIISNNIISSKDMKFLVLDEADEVLHDIFYKNLRWILDNSNEYKQMIVTTATVPSGVQYIVDRYMKYHEYVDVSNEVLSVPDQIRHKAVLYLYEEGVYNRAIKWVLKTEHQSCTMLFVKYKRKCSPMAEYVRSLGYTTKYINSEMPQSMREKVMDSFKAGEFEVLVTTDVSARGVDVPQCELVVHVEPDTHITKYIHRSGRTGRNGRVGTSLLLLQQNNESHMKFLEELSDTINFEYYQYGKFQKRKLTKSD